MLSVVIPTYNRAGLVLECLQPLVQQEVPMEIIVCDDGSMDGTAERVQRHYPQAQVVCLPRNRGFAAAANAGIRTARGEWLLLLNNDVTLAPHCIARMLQTAASTGAFMVAPLILWRDDPSRVYSLGDRICANGRPEAIGFREAADALPQENLFGISAACGLYHRTVFDELGGFEESFVAYFEDADLAFRARLAGFTAATAPDAVAFHIGSASIAGNTWWRSAQCYRNHALLLLRNMPWPLIRTNWRAILHERRHQRAMMFSAARAKFGAVRAAAICLRYMLWLLVSIPGALHQRRNIQRDIKISIRELRAALRSANLGETFRRGRDIPFP